ncbi:MAG TPA: hypothetical protein VMC84_06955 [Methanocella sp.]|uniref:hypothetical protein n=1 Tax=Methanocella sp. TaxID=2052833 RepID=UPI002B9F757C|nr:hypothetical protein [Methanocella sp.]HTY90901.1 hypothetical protein [Methanocella sp.]
MRKVVLFKMDDYKKHPEHTIKLIIHSANMGRLEEGTLERIKQSDPNASVEVWHAVVGQNTAEITISRQKSEATIVTI